MTRTLTKLAVALAALFVPAAFSPAQAHAVYSINLECTPPDPGNPSWAGTTNIITIKAVKKNGSKKTLVSKAITQSDCYTFANVTQGFDTDLLSNVVRFEITTNGNDAFWADRVWAQEGNTFISWEVNNSIGFCLRATPFNSPNCVFGQGGPQWSLITGN